MPPADQMETEGQQVRVLAYGPAKSRKTWWAFQAAEAGYNVIYLNGENNTKVLQNLSTTARSRIAVLNVYDNIDRPVLASFCTKFLVGYDLRWDDVVNALVLLGTACHPAHGHYFLNIRKTTLADVLVLDSWTALVVSVVLQFCAENGIDPEKALKLERDIYGYQDRVQDWMLKQLAVLPCHVIVIAHTATLDLMKKKLDEKGKVIDVPIGEQREQPISSSKNHGRKLAKHFTDVLRFHVEGTHVHIDTRAHQEADGGSNTVHEDAQWSKIPFSRFAGTRTHDGPSAGCIWYPAGTAPATGTGSSKKPVAKVEALQPPLPAAAEGGEAPVKLAGLTIRSRN